ncbi:hypothetical protein FISHEDRAFT_66712 [Fistulina hepatica ATCC 64428]|uniref:Phosphotransferase n=1 Tax=Fistulina hepatica ATCC 64428 TaxID=1128425 RepID=A0A0D7A7P3_9AGAR|nr:hypothetical protein FISHEDRAFT_66712 [Fistulina hepatica ATCC 64428]
MVPTVPPCQSIFDDLTVQFTLDDEILVSIATQFLVEFKAGLEKYNQPMAMIPTFVTGVPDGTEQGTFLALDLGGTNLRVCEVKLNGDRTFSLKQQKYKVSETLKTGEARALFDYMADSVDAFLTSTGSSGSESSIEDRGPLNLGLTFSFPVEQTALASGKILTWTKGFSAKNAIGNDVVQLLQDAFDRKHMHVKCVALVNDTVGALLSRAYAGGGCLLGAIFGTGTNGAYVEDMNKFHKMANQLVYARGGHMIVNCEWGAFNNTRTHLPSTRFDNTVDRVSINSGFQAFEKFISGMYLGEITRNVLVYLVDTAPTSLLFSGKSTKALNEQYGLDTSVMSSVEEAWGLDGGDPTPDINAFDEKKLTPSVKERLQRVKQVIVKDIGFKEADVTLRDAAIVRWVSSLVARRAALMSGIAVAAVLIQTRRAALKGHTDGIPLKTDEDRIVVGVDGSLIQHYPHFERTMRESLRALVGESVERRVEIGHAKDGSGVGAALCALMAVKHSS